MIAETIDILEAQTRFRELLVWVETGHEVILTDQQKPIVRLTPVENSAQPRLDQQLILKIDSTNKQKKPRRFGSAKGLIKIADDFTQPLAELQEYM